MKQTMTMRWLVTLGFLCVVLLAATAGVWAQSVYSLSWNTVDSGGEMFSTGGDYSLGSTSGQLDVGTLSGGRYSVVGGFWGGVAPQPASPTPTAVPSPTPTAGPPDRVYLPVVLDNAHP